MDVPEVLGDLCAASVDCGLELQLHLHVHLRVHAHLTSALHLLQPYHSQHDLSLRLVLNDRAVGV